MADRKPELFIVAGPNGSGKTTVTEEILRRQWEMSCKYINPDNVAEKEFGSWNDENAVRKAAEYCQKQRYECLEKEESLMFETVLSSKEKLDYIKLAKEKGYFVRIFFIGTETPEINSARITRRFMNGGHTVPIEKIVSRFWKSHQNLTEIIPTVDRCYIFDNSIDGEKAELLYKISDGMIQKKYSSRKVIWADSLESKLTGGKDNDAHLTNNDLLPFQRKP